MSENTSVLQLKAFDIATAPVDRPLCIRSIKPSRENTLQMLHLKREEQTRMFYKTLKLANDMHNPAYAKALHYAGSANY